MDFKPSFLKKFLNSLAFTIIHIAATILALLIYLFETSHLVQKILKLINSPFILHLLVILYTLMSFWIFIRNFHSKNQTNPKEKQLDWKKILKNISCSLFVLISYTIVIILDHNGKFAIWFIPALLILTVSILLYLVNRLRFGKMFYFEFQKQYTDRFSEPVLEKLLKLKGLNFIKNEIDLLYNIQHNQEDPNKHENLMHIAYNTILNTNHALSELNKIDLVTSKSPKDLKESFEKSILELETFHKNHNDDKSFAWYVSLIKPQEWLSHEWNKNYFKPFLNTIYNKNFPEKKLVIDIRRVRIITNEDFNLNDESLFEIMFIERLYGINSKVLVIDNSIIKFDDDTVFETISDITLLDYCILYKSSVKYFEKEHNSKVALCSDIKPYYIEQTSATNKVYLIKDLYIFNDLYEHFMLSWNFNDFIKKGKREKILTTPKLGKGNISYSFKDLICSENFSLIKSNLTKEKIKKIFEAFILHNVTIPEDKTASEFQETIIHAIDTVFTDWIANPPNSEDEIQNTFRTKLKSIFFKEIKHTQNEF